MASQGSTSSSVQGTHSVSQENYLSRNLLLANLNSELDTLDDEVRAGQEGGVRGICVEGGVAGRELGGHGLLGSQRNSLVLLSVEVHDLDAVVPRLVGRGVREDTGRLPAQLRNGLGLEDRVDIGVEDGLWGISVDLVTLQVQWEVLSAEHIQKAGSVGGSKGGEVDEHDDAALFVVGRALLVSKPLDGVAANHAAVRVNDDDDLLAGVGEGLNGGPQNGGVLLETDGRGLRADGGEGDGLGLVALERQTGADEVEGLRTVPGARGEDHSGQSGGGGHEGRGKEAGDLWEHVDGFGSGGRGACGVQECFGTDTGNR
ncbi:FAD binding domain-containing protein [Colletotrichum scovillei]|uniref:FAD binding domain-containing protein n=1 Tax=Colletotrichum scovillei TaxID=1209932 RepID=A0A9P7RBF0_9PEZI|nr:FAD binding domain-containing protein [Colletotrichum scovillei]